MTATLAALRVVAALAPPLLSLWLAARVRSGKEDPARVPERWGRSALPRPPGKLVWMHAASVGESLLLLQILRELDARMGVTRPEVLITTQTLTSARLLASRLPQRARHQMAPLDVPEAIGRFLDHWRPDAFVLAESEFWPTTLNVLKKRAVTRLLVNARMRAKSITGWAKRGRALASLLEGFAFIGAADTRTAEGLARLGVRTPTVVGNLKLDQVPNALTAAQAVEATALRASVGAAPVLLAASTHAGEEAIALAAWQALRHRWPDLRLIVAPRHPERGAEVAGLLGPVGPLHRRSTDGPGWPAQAPVLLADTLGEMALWYATAQVVLLGGGHKAEVGGHNPVEAARLGLPVVTGPQHGNFADVIEALSALGAVRVAGNADAVAAALDAGLSGAWHRDEAALATLWQRARAPVEATLDALVTAIAEARSRHA
jgi:3-deoxy-D-manno-octulosonic-acid transferase